ncbi:MAG: IscS subfamily cysteine desulfurase [Selenomonadaceae bacterium]|nr:IscS subfamily cysteine desulfurase [Selenomonadaceae bacterium]
MIYADNAATTKMNKISIDAMTDCIKNFWGNPSSLYYFGQIAKEKLNFSRKIIANCIGAISEEIYFTSGGSESDNQAIISAAKIGAKKNKKHIISTKFEHHAVLHTLKKLEREGFEIELLDVHENGIIFPEQIKNSIREDTCLVTIMFANNEIGTVQPIEEIGKICRENKIIFHTDAVQAAGHLKIDVKNQNIDMLSISAHKFHGPKGTGVLYVRKGIPLTNLIEGGAQEKNKRAGTENLPAIFAMAMALKDACENLEKNNEKIYFLREKIIDGLEKIPHSILNGDRKNRLPGNINFCFEGIEGESLLLLLDDKKICASSGSACTSGSLELSHVLLAIGRPHEIAHGSLRLSIDENISENDAEYIIKSVGEVVEYLRNISPLWKDKIFGKKEFFLK